MVVPHRLGDPPPLRRGMNLGGWLSQLGGGRAHVRSFISPAALDEIRGFGFDHVRVPLDERFVFPGGPGGPPDAFAVQVLGELCEWTERAGLTLVLGLHQTHDHSFLTPAANTLWDHARPGERLAAFWSPVLAQVPAGPGLVVDLLNEPTIGDPVRWWGVACDALGGIRRARPGQWVVVESTPLDGVKAHPRTVPWLPATPPPGVIYGFHFYEPMGFTHQSAPWSSIGRLVPAPQTYPGPLRPPPGDLPGRHRRQFDGTWDRSRLAAIVSPVAAWAAVAGVRLHCGELGAYVDGPADARHRWVEDVVDVLESEGIAWTYWTYKNMGFGLRYDTPRRRAQPEYASGLDRELLRRLVGRPA